LSDINTSQASTREAPTTEVETINTLASQDQPEQDQREQDRPSVAGMLRVAAELVDRAGLPEPVSVQASEQFGIEFDIATHAQLAPWLELFGFTIEPWRTMPFEWSGVMHTLTTVAGLWCGTRVHLRCCEPVDVSSALRGEHP
jgi:hypothetical protein